MTEHLIAPDRRDERWTFRHAIWAGLTAIAATCVLVVVPPHRLFAMIFRMPDTPAVVARPAAFGVSGDVRVQLKLPGEAFEFPLDIATPGAATYEWVAATDSVAASPPQELVAGAVTAPERPGFYQLAVSTGGQRTIVGDIMLAVIVPFDQKVGASLNGYRIGTYRAERGRREPAVAPRGFVEVREDEASLWVTNHLQLADFITHDNQQQWPRYVALDPRILDKVELVLDRLGARSRVMVVDVHSGFRTPLHNRRVPRAVSDSRHQYGDAIDLAFDADGDGLVSYFDILAIARAVDLVEAEHPELVGGLGVYGNHGNVPYVHIDVRGERKRWRG